MDANAGLEVREVASKREARTDAALRMSKWSGFSGTVKVKVEL